MSGVVWGTETLLQMNFVTTGVFRPSHRFGTGRSPEAEPVVHVCKVQLYCSVHPTVIGGGKHLDGPGGITFSTSTKNP